MNSWKAWGIGMAVTALMSVPAQADDDWMAKVMTFALEGDHILAEGAFAPDTAKTFNSFLAANGHAETPWNIALYIRSPGGALVAAVDMGHTLREHGMSVVAYDVCASACTYMLMGGVNRVVTRQAQYGVHQFSFTDATADPDKPMFSARDVETHQIMVGELADYADAMGVDPRVVAVASRTPPSTVTILTRSQLVTFKVDNVPTEEAEGQSSDAVVIPGLTPTTLSGAPDTDTILESLKIKPRIAPHGIAGTVALAMARRLVMAETQDLPGMEESLANSYAFNVEYNGRLLPGEDVVTEKRRMVMEWGVRRRAIDEDSLQVSCSENDITCTVSGDYDYELGVAEGGFISKSRWHFSQEIVLPLALPRVSVETTSLVE